MVCLNLLFSFLGRLDLSHADMTGAIPEEIEGFEILGIVASLVSHSQQDCLSSHFILYLYNRPVDFVE